MKSNGSEKFLSEGYIFGKCIPNFVPPPGVFVQPEVRKLITELGLSIRPDAPFVELERKYRVAFVWRFRRDQERFSDVGKKGFLLAGLSCIPRNSSTASFDYQLELPF